MLDSALMWQCADMPHGPLSAAPSLPKEPGIYFIYRHEKVLYIGTTKNLHKRLSRHHRYFQFASYGADVELAWMLLPDANEKTRVAYERTLTEAFKPLLNRDTLGPMPKGQHSNSLGFTQACHQRQTHKLTQTVVAERSGILPSNLSKIENGTRKIQIHELRPLARAIGCDPMDLVPPEESPHVHP
jgi:predicted GIY-YIG superfamily endonuclease/DNA-binding Xre family transcriptional regulator